MTDILDWQMAGDLQSRHGAEHELADRIEVIIKTPSIDLYLTPAVTMT